ncbi:MAG: sigma-70 family RNA polymerase sigma factor [Planctomycetota bacterium]
MMDDTQHKLDGRLVAAILRGDDVAAREFWGRHAPSLLVYAASINRAIAEDAVQSVFCRLLNLKTRTAGEVADWRAYLATAVRHEVLNRIREQRRRTSREAGAAAQEATSATRSIAERDAIAAALEQLPRRLREVVVLRHSAGLSFDQIALALGCNRSTLASRYSSGVRMLKELLGSQSAGDRVKPEVTNV